MWNSFPSQRGRGNKNLGREGRANRKQVKKKDRDRKKDNGVSKALLLRGGGGKRASPMKGWNPTRTEDFG